MSLGALLTPIEDDACGRRSRVSSSGPAHSHGGLLLRPILSRYTSGATKP
jgi:hypothetical protein